jgi:glycerol-3-phosphate O-acyltransferase
MYAVAVGTSKRIRDLDRSVSVLLFQTALELARNRGLFDPGDDLAKRRVAFLTELRNLLRRINQIEDLALSRYVRDASARPTASPPETVN